jgi:hypothetical protein
MPKTVKVEKAKVLETLRQNKKIHHEEYEEAMNGWIVKAKEKMLDIITQLQSEKARETKIEIHLPKPVSFEKEYEKTIKMIELEISNEIEISNEEFEKFFLDEWEWKHNFLSNTMMYNKK